MDNTKIASTKKAFYGLVPLRAQCDTRLTALHWRILTAIAGFDSRGERFDLQRPGCDANYKLLAERVRCNGTNLVTAITELVEWGYVAREPRGRGRVLRVIYTDDDCVSTPRPAGKELKTTPCPEGGTPCPGDGTPCPKSRTPCPGIDQVIETKGPDSDTTLTTLHNTSNNTLSAAGRPGERFEDFWKAYPHRDGDDPKAPAGVAYKEAIKSGADHDVIIAGAHRLREQAYRKGFDKRRFIPMAAKWLRERRWESYQPSASARVIETSFPQESPKPMRSTPPKTPLPEGWEPGT